VKENHFFLQRTNQPLRLRTVINIIASSQAIPTNPPYTARVRVGHILGTWLGFHVWSSMVALLGYTILILYLEHVLGGSSLTESHSQGFPVVGLPFWHVLH